MKLEAGETGGVDETLVAQNLRLAPEERLDRFRRSYDNVRRLTQGAKRVRGGVA